MPKDSFSTGLLLAVRRTAALSLITACLVATGDTRLARAETIKIGGTGSALACMRHLGTAFERIEPGTTVQVLPSIGSAGGIKAVLAGAIDLAVTSRLPKDEERERGALVRQYGRTPQVFVTRSDTGQQTITLPDVERIYAGEIVNWQDGSPLRLVMRPSTEFNVKYLKTISPEMEKAVDSALARPGLVVATNDQDNLDYIEQIPGSFGIASVAQVSCETRNKISTFAIDGYEPTEKKLDDGTYPLFKGTYFVFTEYATPAVQVFLDFVFSSEGMAILSHNGHSSNF